MTFLKHSFNNIFGKKFNQFINGMSDPSLLAFRGLVAAIIGLSICYFIFDTTGEGNFRERIYWVIFAIISVSLNTNTNVVFSRARSITIFSVIGCATGSLILMLIQKYIDSFSLIAILCSLALMFYIYTIFLDYGTSIFFIHVYLVLFFGLFVYWDFDLFIVRVICVFVGTISILAVFLLTKTSKNKEVFLSELNILYKEFEQKVNCLDRRLSNTKLIELVQKNIDLNEMLLAAKYEFATRKEYHSYKKIILLMDELLINLKTYRVLFIRQQKHKDSIYQEFVSYTSEQIKKNFEKLSIRYVKIHHTK